MVDKSIINAARNYLRILNQEGIPVRFGVLFGSWVRGRADRWSDIDLVVVSPRFDHGPTRADVQLLWRQAGRCDSRIEPVACGEEQWQTDDSSEIIEIARREGQHIAVDE
jgi:hypothetical protein